jgi:magnesium-transporting ATPase (P-type)
LIGGTPPLSVVQLLWMNLIMDTFAAIALGSERPHPSIVKTPPVKDNEPLLTSIMWRQIYGMSLYITIVMIFLYFFLDNMWGLTYKVTDIDRIDAQYRYTSKGAETTALEVYTLMFNVFIWMHIFNEINCRKVGATEYNVFHNLLANYFFMGVMVFIMVVQTFMVNFLGQFSQCKKLTGQQHAFCIIWGATVLLISVLLKLSPPEWFDKIPMNLVDENKALDENDPILAKYNQQAKAKVTKKKDDHPKVEDEVKEADVNKID